MQEVSRVLCSTLLVLSVACNAMLNICVICFAGTTDKQQCIFFSVFQYFPCSVLTYRILLLYKDLTRQNFQTKTLAIHSYRDQDWPETHSQFIIISKLSASQMYCQAAFSKKLYLFSYKYITKSLAFPAVSVETKQLCTCVFLNERLCFSNYCIYLLYSSISSVYFLYLLFYFYLLTLVVACQRPLQWSFVYFHLWRQLSSFNTFFQW